MIGPGIAFVNRAAGLLLQLSFQPAERLWLRLKGVDWVVRAVSKIFVWILRGPRRVIEAYRIDTPMGMCTVMTPLFAAAIASAALGLVLAVDCGQALGQERPTEEQILKALSARGPARGAHDPSDPGDRAQSGEERRFLEILLKKKPRTITVDERRRVAEITSEKPSIDLDIPFEFNSAAIGPQAVPVLITLGRALGNAELAGATLLIAGHTDAKGGDGYNQDLSERRAEAVKRYLAEQFKLAPEHLLAIGFGKSQLKNAADPFAGENRRVQVVNTGQ